MIQPVHVVMSVKTCIIIFFDCILYRRERETLFDNLSRYCNVSLNVILWGSPKLSDEQNGYIFQYVQNFIKSSNRF